MLQEKFHKLFIEGIKVHLYPDYINLFSFVSLVIMKIECLFVGKTSEKYLEDGMQIYLKRLAHYLHFSVAIIPSVSELKNQERKIKKESDSILSKIHEKDFVILLDEKGKEFSSVQLSDYLGKIMVNGTSKIYFIVGGAYGVSEEIKKRANFILSFSKFTITHQMIRILLLEQIYRAMTIIRNERYHHN
jgi:23S rRNA (pseudouridine1915-N3)-methyltransferase